MRVAALLLTAALAAACATRPLDPFVVAQRSLLRHDLAESLRALDAVPVVHARYPEARAAAVAVERSMRRCHELMLEAMLLRSEWRDREALLALRKAESIWPELPGAAALIAATEQRLRLLGGRGDAARAPATPMPSPSLLSALEPESAPQRDPLPPALPADESSLAPPAAPTAEARTWSARGAPAAEPTTTPGSAPAVPTVPAGASAGATTAAPPAAGTVPAASVGSVVTPPVANSEDPVALGLVAVETRLGRNQLEPAVADLLELSRRFPNDVRVRVRLVRLLHQRALLRYGEGAVAMAVADWRRMLEIDPQHGPARRMLDAVELEGR